MRFEESEEFHLLKSIVSALQSSQHCSISDDKNDSSEDDCDVTCYTEVSATAFEDAADSEDEAEPAKTAKTARTMEELPTTLVLRNIPTNMSQEEVKLTYFPSVKCFDFLYVPSNILKPGTNLGYAVVNLCTSDAAVAYWAASPHGSVSVAEIQGLRANIAHYCSDNGSPDTNRPVIRHPRRKTAPPRLPMPEGRKSLKTPSEREGVPRDPLRVFVGGLAANASQQILKEYLEQFGEVHSVQIVCNTVTKLSRGFAIVKFADVDGAIKALAHPRHCFLGREIGINSYKARRG